jgi:hypothetical protein
MLKRVIPFITTFALGLLIASLFVTIVPQFNFKRSSNRVNHYNKHQIITDLRIENEQLRSENRRLKAKQTEDFQEPYVIEVPSEFDNIVPAPKRIEPNNIR